MKIGFVGAGRMAQMLTPHLVAAGHEVILTNSRGPESLKDLVATLGPAVSAASVAQMVETADIVVLATPWGKTKDAVAQAPAWGGRIVVDPTNNRTKPGPDGLIDIGGRGSSQVVAELVPGAQVVKTLNYEPIPVFGEGLSATEPKALFLAGDSAAAKAKVGALIASLGAEPIDVGSLAVGDDLLKGGGPLALKMRLLKPDEARKLLASLA
jgi:hypothetical protein